MNGQSPNLSEHGRTLIIGSTGFIGRFVTDACLESGHPTYLLVRGSKAKPSAKASIIKSFEDRGAIIIHGTIKDQDLMEKVMREEEIEFVISTVGGDCIADQVILVDAIKAVGSVKRFLPSEFGHDIDRAEPVEPGLSFYKEKRKIRRYIEKSGIPYSYICCNSIAAWPYHNNTHPSDMLPPLDRFQIYGDGTVKAYFVAGTDIGKFTIKSLDDARTLNKSLHFRPATNLLDINELASLWESKIGHRLPRVTITEDDLLAAAKEMKIPPSIVAALTHDIFFNGCQINYSLDKDTDAEVTMLYPDMHFRTICDCFNDFVARIVNGNPQSVSMSASSKRVMVDAPITTA